MAASLISAQTDAQKQLTFACRTCPILVCPQPCFEAFELSAKSAATAQRAGPDVAT